MIWWNFCHSNCNSSHLYFFKSFIDHSWRSKRFQIWRLWKIIFSFSSPESTHQNHSWMSERFQMWLLWKIIFSFSWPREYSSKPFTNFFTKVTQILNVMHMEMKGIKIANLNLMANHLLVWRNTLMHSWGPQRSQLWILW